MMNKRIKRKGNAEDALLVVFLLFVMSLVGFASGYYFGGQSVRVEAVKKGKAEWVAQPSGSTVFAWKE